MIIFLPDNWQEIMIYGTFTNLIPSFKRRFRLKSFTWQNISRLKFFIIVVLSSIKKIRYMKQTSFYFQIWILRFSLRYGCNILFDRGWERFSLRPEVLLKTDVMICCYDQPEGWVLMFTYMYIQLNDSTELLKHWTLVYSSYTFMIELYNDVQLWQMSINQGLNIVKISIQQSNFKTILFF